MIEFVGTFIGEFWSTVAQMSPYLLFGFLMAGVLSVLISPAVVERHLGGRGLWPIVKASAFGVPLPLCSCGVIPVSMSLYKHGASKGATVAFLLSTPQTGLENIAVIYSLMGPVFAIFSPIVTLITGLVGGSLVDAIEPHGAGRAATAEKCHDVCCSGRRKPPALVRIFEHGFVTLPRDIAGAMLAGLVIAAAISALVPDDFFGPVLGGGIVSMLVMMALGIPMYVCATASIPIAAALIEKGVSPGAAMAFLMTGPVTNAAGIMTIWSRLGRRTALAYLASAAGCALGAGLFLDAAFPDLRVTMQQHVHAMEPTVFGQACAVVLILLLGYALVARRSGRRTDG